MSSQRVWVSDANVYEAYGRDVLNGLDLNSMFSKVHSTMLNIQMYWCRVLLSLRISWWSIYRIAGVWTEQPPCLAFH